MQSSSSPSTSFCVARRDALFRVLVTASALLSLSIDTAHGTPCDSDPACTLNPNATTIYLKKDCGVHPENSNCFEDFDLAQAHVWGLGPSGSNRILWDIGPGKWDATYECDESGFVTLRGAGRDQTIIRGAPGSQWAGTAIDCDKLEFIDLEFQSKDYAFYWQRDGSSTWTDVDLLSLVGGTVSASWADEYACVDLEETAVHYFYGSKLDTRDGSSQGGYPAAAYSTYCSETWFYGGEIHYHPNGGTGANGAALRLNSSDFRAFGTAIRADGAARAIWLNGDPLPGTSYPQAVFHMHGGIINTSFSGLPTAVTMLENSFVHTPGTAYVLQAGAGFPTRRVSFEGGDGGASATALIPFLWQAGKYPPTASSEVNILQSQDGSDIFVETDCTSSGLCEGGSEPHMMIFAAEECGATNPWFDVVTGACRVDPTP